MRRAERLAEIVEIVRDGRLHKADDLAEALSVSARTIYRDIASLIASGVSIEGERGLGYILREPVFLPPMALTGAELEALTLGMEIVRKTADEELTTAAISLLAKIERHAALRRRAPSDWGFGVYQPAFKRRGFTFLPIIRRAIRAGHKLRIAYLSLSGDVSERTVRPLQTEYWGQVWTFSAWCELRGDFRVFRVDRLDRCEATDAVFSVESGKTLRDYLNRVAAQMSKVAQDDG
ncbi:YafY family protein [Sphingomonas sp. 28-62-11]|uniref:helix-turn-helix transcriptional regulator n=1 Tax=Sphingomonas sp. 28-62-11 TaxID=1970432 RepID=UPI000BDAAE47|nr:MAG: transcriptional regulator [Sphingomonas sp. 28-62-11]